VIVECYSADVYCDSADHEYGVLGAMNAPATFVGRNKRETDKERRGDGWIKVNGHDICPVCAKNKPIRISEANP